MVHPIIDPNVSLLVVGIATIVDVFLGSMWYSVLFGDPWLRLMRRDKNDARFPTDTSSAKMRNCLLSSMVSSAIKVYFMAHTLPHLLYGIRGAPQVESTTSSAVLAAVWLYVGFVFTNTFHNDMWADRPLGLTLIHASSAVTGLVVSAVLLTALPPYVETIKEMMPFFG